jgi:hypothetical protein
MVSMVVGRSLGLIATPARRSAAGTLRGRGAKLSAAGPQSPTLPGPGTTGSQAVMRRAVPDALPRSRCRFVRTAKPALSLRRRPLPARAAASAATCQRRHMQTRAASTAAPAAEPAAAADAGATADGEPEEILIYQGGRAKPLRILKTASFINCTASLIGSPIIVTADIAMPFAARVGMATTMAFFGLSTTGACSTQQPDGAALSITDVQPVARGRGFSARTCLRGCPALRCVGPLPRAGFLAWVSKPYLLRMALRSTADGTHQNACRHKCGVAVARCWGAVGAAIHQPSALTHLLCSVYAHDRQPRATDGLCQDHWSVPGQSRPTTSL